MNDRKEMGRVCVWSGGGGGERDEKDRTTVQYPYETCGTMETLRPFFQFTVPEPANRSMSSVHKVSQSGKHR